MAYRARVADKLMRRSAEQLVTTAGVVITGLTNIPAFSSSNGRPEGRAGFR